MFISNSKEWINIWYFFVWKIKIPIDTKLDKIMHLEINRITSKRILQIPFNNQDGDPINTIPLWTTSSPIAAIHKTWKESIRLIAFIDVLIVSYHLKSDNIDCSSRCFCSYQQGFSVVLGRETFDIHNDKKEYF